MPLGADDALQVREVRERTGDCDVGQCVMGSTTVRLGGKGVTFAAVELPQLRDDPVVTDTSVTFVQTYGGRTALPAPRHVPRPPFVQFRAPLVWTIAWPLYM